MFPATSLTVIVFVPYTKLSFISSKVTSTFCSGVTLIVELLLILYDAISYSSYNLKLTFEYIFLSLFPTKSSFTLISGAMLSYINSYVDLLPALSLTLIVFFPYTN